MSVAGAVPRQQQVPCRVSSRCCVASTVGAVPRQQQVQTTSVKDKVVETMMHHPLTCQVIVDAPGSG